MTIAFRVYFVVAGLVMLATSVALLINFRGLGTRWDKDVVSHSRAVIRLTRIPWVANPATGRVWRPYAAIFGIAVSIVVILTGLFAG